MPLKTEKAPRAAAAEDHGLRPSEFDAIRKRLGREPNRLETGIYAAMWSEHCAYKHSRRVLRRLPTRGPRVLIGPGENAGVIDVGGGLCVAFKMESHNHPSAVEPYQGAATGVGGILHDVFAMGARPIALLDNLRFGEPGDPEMRRLISGVVEGIAGYGNCVGVPTVGGDAMFDPGFAGAILVNVACIGVARRGEIARTGTPPAGGSVLYFGSPTGRDGIHGATFASEELSDETRARRSAVQVGDPFMGKKILEASLELVRSGLVAGIHDMGAAGLTCAGSELAARAGVGMEIDLDRVPQRAADMSAYEIMLSESQERMLAICDADKIEAALEVCRRWECGGAVIGRVDETGKLVVRRRGEVVVDLPVEHLTEGAPECEPEAKQPPRPTPIEDPPALRPDEIPATLLRLLASPTLGAKRWIYRQFDYGVQGNTVVRPGEAGAAVVRLPEDEDGRRRFLAMATAGNHRYALRDARAGGRLAVCEAARKLVCAGAQPLGATDCLNFGSPERPGVFGAFVACIEGIAEACETLGVPITGGNVSFYNESGGAPIPPTPMIGMVGLIDDAAHVARAGFAGEGDEIYVVGPLPGGIGGSEYAKLTVGPDRPGAVWGELPATDLRAEAAMQRAALRAIRRGPIRSARSVGRGGLLRAIAECCLKSKAGLGARIENLPDAAQNLAAACFGELPPRILFGVAPENSRELIELMRGADVEIRRIGAVGGDALCLVGAPPLPLQALRDASERDACGRPI